MTSWLSRSALMAAGVLSGNVLTFLCWPVEPYRLADIFYLLSSLFFFAWIGGHKNPLALLFFFCFLRFQFTIFISPIDLVHFSIFSFPFCKPPDLSSSLLTFTSTCVAVCSRLDSTHTNHPNRIQPVDLRSCVHSLSYSPPGHLLQTNKMCLICSVMRQSFVIPKVSVSSPCECHTLSVHCRNPVMCGFCGAN